MSMYPDDWPRCACGDFALDGKATCGRADCMRARHEGENVYDFASRNGEQTAARGGDWRDNPHTPGTREWFEFEDGLQG